ncbi:hypothetical protein [Sphingomonas faeni]|nr:hypothetical protein [Sphingomonas faeni]
MPKNRAGFSSTMLTSAAALLISFARLDASMFSRARSRTPFT